MNNQIIPRSTALHDPADFSVSEQNGGLPLWWADRSENTYRAEDRQGNTLFTAVSARLMQPLPPITGTQVFDRNGVPMYSNGWLVGALWNGATLSAQVPGEPHLHYLFTIAQDGKPYAHLIDLSSTGHGSQGEVVKANIPLDGGGPLTYQRGMAVVDDRSGYGPTTLFLLGHSGTQAQLRALSVAAFHADNNTPDWHTLETVTATPAILKGRLQPSPDGQRLAYARTFGTGMGLLQWGGNELRVVRLDPGRLALSGAPLTVAGPTGRITGLDFSPAADYLYFTVSGLSYPTTQRLCRLPLAGGAIAPMAWHVTDVRRNAQQGGTHMLCTTTTGLRRIAQPDDASPTQTTHALPGIQPALALQPVLIGPDRSTSTRHLGRRRYELTDHLGNVRAVVGDRKLSDFSLDINTPVLVPTSFSAEVLSYADYDPFGSLLDERHALAYRFGFQGQEQDDEIHDDPGTSYAFEYRMHDARVGRFWSVDPLAAKYPWNSPYAFSENRVIDGVELEGLEYASFNIHIDKDQKVTKIEVTTDYELKKNGSQGPGVQYRILGHNGFPMEVRFVKNLHGIYQGGDNPQLPRVGGDYRQLYDNYDLEPIDETDANAKQHDIDYDKDRLAGFKGIMDERSTQANRDYNSRTAATIAKYEKGENDSVTGRPVTKETKEAAEFGKKWFNAAENIKRDMKPENRAKMIQYGPKL
ncbi:MAG: hypothetical protein IPM49_02035 [Flavobacteriales bacterium]|nr:hypothetical protein [Flavobacteriales bacterium]